MKLFANFLNAIAIGLIGFAVLKPLTEDFSKMSLVTLWWGLAGLVFHAFSHYILGLMRKAAP